MNRVTWMMTVTAIGMVCATTCAGAQPAGSPMPADPGSQLATQSVGEFQSQEVKGIDIEQTIKRANSAETSGPIALDTVAKSIKPTDAMTRRLRDKLLLQVGYRDIAEGKPVEARAAFSLVSEPGAGTNAALLGLGWAFVYPDKRARDKAAKTSQVRVMGNPLQYGLFTGSKTIADARRAIDLRRALVPWEQLIGRNPADPAVQEGMLAIPYVLDHLGAYEDALDYRVRAIAMLERVHRALVRSQTDGSVDALIDAAFTAPRPQQVAHAWFATLPRDKWWLLDSADPPRTFYWQDVLEDDAIVSALDDLQRSKLGGDALQGARARLHELIESRLAWDDRSTQAYLAEARYALARGYEPRIGGDQ